MLDTISSKMDVPGSELLRVVSPITDDEDDGRRSSGEEPADREPSALLPFSPRTLAAVGSVPRKVVSTPPPLHARKASSSTPLPTSPLEAVSSSGSLADLPALHRVPLHSSRDTAVAADDDSGDARFDQSGAHLRPPAGASRPRSTAAAGRGAPARTDAGGAAGSSSQALAINQVFTWAGAAAAATAAAAAGPTPALVASSSGDLHPPVAGATSQLWIEAVQPTDRRRRRRRMSAPISPTLGGRSDAAGGPRRLAWLYNVLDPLDAADLPLPPRGRPAAPPADAGAAILAPRPVPAAERPILVDDRAPLRPPPVPAAAAGTDATAAKLAGPAPTPALRTAMARRPSLEPHASLGERSSAERHVSFQSVVAVITPDSEPASPVPGTMQLPAAGSPAKSPLARTRSDTIQLEELRPDLSELPTLPAAAATAGAAGEPAARRRSVTMLTREGTRAAEAALAHADDNTSVGSSSDAGVDTGSSSDDAEPTSDGDDGGAGVAGDDADADADASEADDEADDDAATLSSEEALEHVLFDDEDDDDGPPVHISRVLARSLSPPPSSMLRRETVLPPDAGYRVANRSRWSARGVSFNPVATVKHVRETVYSTPAGSREYPTTSRSDYAPPPVCNERQRYGACAVRGVARDATLTWAGQPVRPSDLFWLRRQRGGDQEAEAAAADVPHALRRPAAARGRAVRHGERPAPVCGRLYGLAHEVSVRPAPRRPNRNRPCILTVLAPASLRAEAAAPAATSTLSLARSRG